MVGQQVATGSIFQNSNQFFKDLPTSAIVAYFTSYTDTGQHQYVAYSLDNGSSYQPYNNGKPVMTSQTKSKMREILTFGMILIPKG